MSIRFGVCATFDKIPVLISAGYDYLEFGLKNLVNMSDAEFEAALETVKKYNFYAESFNTFFSAEIALVGEKVDFNVISEYCEKGLKRAAALGGKIAVIGSGKSRKIPEDFDRNTAYNQFLKVLGIAGSIAEKYEMLIVVEPLYRGETNFINTVDEGLEISKAANRENVKSLADLYHLYMNGESLDTIINEGKSLAHLHLARPNPDRDMPYEEDIPTVNEWAKAVKQSGYSGRLSLEGGFNPTFEEAIIRTKRIIEAFK